MSYKKINGYTINLKQLLGKGSYASVFRGSQDITKRQCAIKVLDKKLIDHDEYLKSAVFKQIQILQLIKSENVVGVFDALESSNNYYIIQQICDSDLQKYIEEHKNISEEQAINFLKQICNGFLALVKEGIVHRDLKPANILLCKGVVKIGDFGFAKKNITKRMMNASSVGTPLYMSLEVLKSQGYTSKCDVWATGFIFYEMLHNRTPWIANSEYQLVKNIENKPLVIGANFQQNTKDILLKILKIHEKDRMSWDQVFMHPIFKGHFHKYSQQNEQFQNKLKRVMTELRFRINSNNIDLTKLLQSLNIKKNMDLNYEQFTKFLRYIHSDITKEQIAFFFEKMDHDDGGSISISQLTAEMEKNHIVFQKVSIQQSLKETCHQGMMSNDLQMKVRKCFSRLYKILTIKKLNLYKIFQLFDTDKSGELVFQQFQHIIKRLDESFSQEQLRSIFIFLDTDNSKTIEFDQMNRYYCKVNGIPEGIDLPAEYYEKLRNKGKKM